MRRISVKQAKAQLSALLDAVEQGEEVEITRRGVPVARLTGASREAAKRFDLASFLATTARQPMHAAALVNDLRAGARF